MPDRIRFYHYSTQKMEDASLSLSYQASFAGGGSGLSFGHFQNDIARNEKARIGFEQILLASGEFDANEMEKLKDRLYKSGISEHDFSHEELAKINAALSSPEGRTMVDSIDNTHVVERLDPWVEQTLSAVQKNPNGLGVFDPAHSDHTKAVAMAAAWVNRTGAPTKLLEYLAGDKTILNKHELHLESAPTLEDLCAYFKTTKQFSPSGNAENFANWETRIDHAVTYAKTQMPATAPIGELNGEQKPVGEPKSYQVVAGDTLWKISKQFGLSLKELLAANPQLSKTPHYIRPGYKIQIPTSVQPLQAERRIGVDERYERVPKTLWPSVSMLPEPPPVMGDPLIFDLNGNGIETIGIQQGIHFDLNANRFKELTSWVGPEDGFLVLDHNGNGTIDSGKELFGGDTLLPSGSPAEHGFHALTALDGRNDIVSSDSRNPKTGSCRLLA